MQGGKYIIKKNMILCVPEFDPITTNEQSPVNFLQRPYQKLDFMQALESATGKKFPDPENLAKEDSIKFLQDQINKNNLECDQMDQAAKLLDKLFSKLIEPELQQPTFVLYNRLKTELYFQIKKYKRFLNLHLFTINQINQIELKVFSVFS